MSDIDRAGEFYLGRRFDLQAGRGDTTPVWYPSRHLTTHAVVLGMTGSGKTGLGLVMLEEALLQGIPTLILDPKGDLTNLLLAFPDLRPEDFAPWVDVDGAQRQGLTVEAYAADVAHRWQQGLAEWGIDGERIGRMRQSCPITLFTPGSDAGMPLDVLHQFNMPGLDWETQAEVLRDRVRGLVSAVLGLAGITADPVQSREHILLSHIVEHVWRAGEPLDLPTLIRLLAQPPITQVGVFDLETFFPQKDRMGLALALNNLIAAPGFENWRRGEPLDISRLLRTPEGQPRAGILYMAHLSDQQRQFFVALLLQALVEWMTLQSGTSDLRALLYFDELFGYFPPHPANPPTKEPLLRLIKQGRAAGLGLILATQNPVDLDYKGLTNAGTWFVGSLRSAQDKDRVLEGVAGAAAEAGSAVDRRALDQALGSLPPRVFLMHDVRAGQAGFFQTRWAMSYLRGPLTRVQVRELTGGYRAPAAAPDAGSAPTAAAVAGAAGAAVATQAPAGPTAPTTVETPGLRTPPTLSPDLPQAFLPPNVTVEWAQRSHEEESGRTMLARNRQLAYTPYLLAAGNVHISDAKRGIAVTRQITRLIEPQASWISPDWEVGEAQVDLRHLSRVVPGEGIFRAIPAGLGNPQEVRRWAKDFGEYLYRGTAVQLYYNPALKVYGQPEDSERNFRDRCVEAARQQRDAETAKAQATYEREKQRLEQALAREQRELEQDQAQLEARKREEMLSGAESVLNLVTRRRPSTALSKASTKRRLAEQARAEVDESVQTIADLEQQLRRLDEQWRVQKNEINDRWFEMVDNVTQEELRPRRADVLVDFVGLAWVPQWEIELESGQVLALPAYAVEE